MKVNAAAPIAFQPFGPDWVDLALVPTAVHVTVLTEDLQWALSSMCDVFPCLIPPMFADHPFPAYILKMQHDDVFQIQRGCARRLRNPRAMNPLSMMVRA